VAKRAPKTVLIIDRDLGFVFWLGQTLDAAGFAAIPARDVPNAISIITEHHLAVDVVVLNAVLANAVPLIAALQRPGHPIRFVAVGDSQDDTRAELTGVTSIRIKPPKFNQHYGREWVELINAMVSGRVAAS
jgi:ActR/RegA family two-component response regulator